MTRDEAINRLQNAAWLGTDRDREETEKAVGMAIEALKTTFHRRHNFREVDTMFGEIAGGT